MSFACLIHTRSTSLLFILESDTANELHTIVSTAM